MEKEDRMYFGGWSMAEAEMVLDIQVLPQAILSKISSKRVKFYEENGTITLTPISDEKPRFDHLIGKFSDGKISIDNFLEEKNKKWNLNNEEYLYI